MHNEPHTPVRIVAELRSNHFGDRERLEQMIRLCKSAGADLVKLQKRSVATFYSKPDLLRRFISPFGTTYGEFRNGVELSLEDFCFVEAICREVGIEWFSSVLDEASLDDMLTFDPSLLKLPSTVSNHRAFLSYAAARYGGDIVISTGMTDSAYEQFILSHFGGRRKLYLLQCTSAYPTPDMECNIGVVRHYRDLARKRPWIVPGYSSHDDGWLGSALAVAAGARMIEKHVTMGPFDEWPRIDPVALDLASGEFADFVTRIRHAEILVGSERKALSRSENHKYDLSPESS